MLQKIKILLSCLVPLMFISCANQLPPGGGKVDTTPPEIVAVYPENGTVNFHDDHMEFTFSEYIDKRSVQDAIFISPALEGVLEFDWSGESVEVKFPEPLQENITYVVMIGTDVQDINNRNNMAQAFSITFSTGDKIDRGIIQGQIFTAAPQGMMVFAYPVSDTLNPTKQKPKYLTQAGIHGDYKLPGLAFDTYRVFAVKDEFRDLLYNIGDDLYGAPYMDSGVNEMDSVFHSLNFMITKEDTLKPKLINAVMTDRYHLLVEFSEPIDSTYFSSKNFIVIDSTLNKTVAPKYAFKGRVKPNEMVLSLNDSLSAEGRVFLAARVISDMTGNISTDENVNVTVSDKPDTSAPKIIAPRIYLSGNPEEQVFNVGFDDGFDTTSARKGIGIIDKDGKKINSSFHFIDDASFLIKPIGQLSSKQKYFISIDFNNLTDAAGNKRDSIYKFEFTPHSTLDFTGVSGIVTSPVVEQNVNVVLQGVDGDKVRYKKAVKDKFNFTRVNPGKYLLWGFADKDSSGTYTYGKPFPFQPAERFTTYSDTLNLRARWPVEDVELKFK